MDGKERRIKRITFAQKEHERRREKERERKREREKEREKRRNSEWRKLTLTGNEGREEKVSD